MRAAALVLVGAACGGAHREPAKPKGPAYLALFERGRTWALPIELTQGHQEKTSGAFVPDQTSRGSLQCRIADVHPLGDAKVAILACAKPYNDLVASGVWVATRAGLFHPPVEPSAEDLARYQQGEPLIAAAPAERAQSDDVEEASSSTQAFIFQHSWCVRETAAAELDRRDYTLCFDARGISGGSELVIVGPEETWQRATFGVAPPDPDDPTRRR